ncbi:hypothetical protein [Polaromonas sp.]|uniref:hypothetical protein n=1 Tax=Polaromonas sp. TaxID=1869339 RepID=UPI0032653A36
MRQAYDVADQRGGHLAALNLWQHYIKPCTAAGGRGRLSWEELDPESRLAMRGLFHGPILTDFATQVWLMDPTSDRHVRYAPAVWKLHLKDLFCPLTQDPKTGAWGKSTERLSDAQYRDFLTACQAYGVMDCGITFTEQQS